MDYELDGITLNQIISMIYCGKCNNGISSDKRENMKEGTNLKLIKEIYHSTGTTIVLWRPNCFNQIKICIPNNEVFWRILNNEI